MGNALYPTIILALFTILLVTLLYLSLKKCFLREGMSRSGLLVRVIFTNPVVVYLIAQILTIFLGAIIDAFRGANAATMINDLTTINVVSLSMLIVGSLLFIFLSVLCSLLVGKWLKAQNVSLVVFVYMVFTVIAGLFSIPDSQNGVGASLRYLNYVNIAAFVIMELLFYHFVIRELAALTDRKRHINWKLFLVPPIVFLLIYYVFDYITQIENDYLSNIVVQVYSMIMVMVFLWSFYIVIKNINATNAAIEARYESEHDKLTGLYNKGKYINMKEDNFGNPDSIAIYNFDVNNLKYINDNFGHELGDELIIKAAQSIHAVVSDNVYGFRMGGDEYAMIAVNITRDEADNIRKRWEQALTELNTKGKVYCVMACGLEYAEGAFVYDELYHHADELMYIDKKARKEKGETSHLKETGESGK